MLRLVVEKQTESTTGISLQVFSFIVQDLLSSKLYFSSVLCIAIEIRFMSVFGLGCTLL
jgi:hypothetical protein